MSLCWVRAFVVLLNCHLLFCGWILSAKATQPLVKKEPWYTLDIGFNLDYPGRVPIQESALNEINNLGINHVRIYEIFAGKGEVTYQKRLKLALDTILKYRMQPMLSISNVPIVLVPDIKERESLRKSLPDRVARQIPEILQYSNRFPPSNLSEYKEKIQELLDFLFDTYGYEQVRHWWFEIGNEPDAPRFFWGSPIQFKLITETATETLIQNNLFRVGGYGVTSHAIFQNETNGDSSREYKKLMADVFSENNDDKFMSFHLYERNNKQNHTEPMSGLPDWIVNSQRQVMITEWNVSSQGRKAKKIFNSPGTWGKQFIHLLVDCYHKKIDRLYLFKLMDSPLFNTAQLGAFDRSGKSKRWFHEFRVTWQVIRNGYQVCLLPHGGVSIRCRNGSKIVLAGSKPIDIGKNFQQIYSSDKGHVRQNGIVTKGKWAILKPVLE